MQKETKLTPWEAYLKAVESGHQDHLQRIAMLTSCKETYIVNYIKNVDEVNIDILLEAVQVSHYYSGNLNKFLDDISGSPEFYKKYIKEIEAHPKFQELKDNIIIKEIIE